jgi:hypothetical protein
MPTLRLHFFFCHARQKEQTRPRTRDVSVVTGAGKTRDQQGQRQRWKAISRRSSLARKGMNDMFLCFVYFGNMLLVSTGRLHRKSKDIVWQATVDP